MAEMQDLVVIGGGSGGFAAAIRAAQLGGKVTVVEEVHYGGNCMNKACIPLTFLATAGRLMGAIHNAAYFGIRVGEPQLDVDALHDRKNLIIESLALGTEEQLADYGATLVEGRGKLVTGDTVEVNGQRIRARNVVIATGSISAPLPIEGSDLPGVLSTEEAINLREIPPRIAIVGNEPWDIELAQYFDWMGSQVTLIASSRQLLPEADRDISRRLAKLLHDDGIGIERDVDVEAIRRGDDGTLTVTLSDGKAEITVDKVLAARRFPNSTGLGLRALGVEMKRGAASLPSTLGGAAPLPFTLAGAVLVNERMQTNVPHIYAIGDVTPGSMWSHKANAEGIVAGENAMGMTSAMEYGALPHCLHTWPEIAWVGLTEDEAKDRGIEVDVGKVPVAINPRAMIGDQTAGALKIVAGKRYGKILGVHMMAPGALDLINVATVAMLSEATVDELMRFIPAHPSIGEAMVDAAMDVQKRSLHLPKW
jgi:dihydrolipoamide dehydrogenase